MPDVRGTVWKKSVVRVYLRVDRGSRSFNDVIGRKYVTGAQGRNKLKLRGFVMNEWIAFLLMNA
jgi:hypothetical protein